ncbi:MAG: hypothetical protein K1X57_09570 [Gemmataceae bacterium]|nr:hypothetical protein [Gemmataceae bacterium]
MAVWNDRWFGGQAMPQHYFPQHMIGNAQSIAEDWLFDSTFRCVLTEWVSTNEADEVMGGLLWSGFGLRGQPAKRVAPKPVLVRLLFSEPHPSTTAELRERMREYFARAVREWIQALQQHGSSLQIAQ